jgi:hypothetical protein
VCEAEEEKGCGRAKPSELTSNVSPVSSGRRALAQCRDRGKGWARWTQQSAAQAGLREETASEGRSELTCNVSPVSSGRHSSAQCRDRRRTPYCSRHQRLTCGLGNCIRHGGGGKGDL